MNFPPPATTIEQLKTRIDLIAGRTLGDVAMELGVAIPENLLVEKGWQGQLIEAFLGASAGNLPEPDFQHLGIELKTLPINEAGKPLETTYVCVAPLVMKPGTTWHDSTVYKKLRHVLWVPVIAERDIAIPDRTIAMPFLWEMPPAVEIQLKTDWQELTDLILLGHHDKISASHGALLQLRPKAADSSVRTSAFDSAGAPIQAPPKGFYLRTQFTHTLLKQQFGL